MHDLASVLEVFRGDRFWIAAAVTAAFSGLARLIRGVSRSGVWAGALVCFSLCMGAGAAAFTALVSVFVLAWVTTRIGYQRKLRLGTAEKREGRSAAQVLANVGTAAVCAVLYALSHNRAVFVVAMAAALSEAAADTVSSEIGQANSGTARLITNWESVPAGTNGGITATGTAAGILGATFVSVVCVITGLLSWRWFTVSVGAAVFGMVADSFLGAWLEQRQLLSNNAVNFFSTVIAAGIAILLV